MRRSGRVEVDVDKDDIDFRMDDEFPVLYRYRTVPSGWVGVWVDEVAILRKSWRFLLGRHGGVKFPLD